MACCVMLYLSQTRSSLTSASCMPQFEPLCLERRQAHRGASTSCMDALQDGWRLKSVKPPENVLTDPGDTNAYHTHKVGGHHRSGLARETDSCQESFNEEGILAQLGRDTEVTTYASLLRRCTSAKALSEGKLVHEHMARRGYGDHIFLNNLVVQMYSRCGSLEYARAMFDKIVCPNLYSWTIMIDACTRHGQGKEALQLFGQMHAGGFEPDKITFTCVLDACASVAALEEGQAIHSIVAGNGWDSDVIVGTSLVNIYGKCGILVDARAVFAEMPLQDVFSWNAMIAACAQNDHGMEALELFVQMQAEGFKPDKISFTCVLNACASVAALEEGREVHATVVGNRWESDIVLGTALVDMYGKCRSLDDARAVFAEMPLRNVVSWSAMIGTCAQSGNGKEALQLFGQMRAQCMKPNKITYICVLDACASVAALEEGHEIHATVASSRSEVDVVLWNALLHMYGKCGSLNDARAVFAEMPLPNVVSWSALMAAFAQNGRGKDTLRVFAQMLAQGVKPNEVTFLCVLTACSHTGLVAAGREYFASMNRDHGLTPLVDHYVCMIDLLGRGGLLEEAEDLILSMPLENVAPAWSSLLSACRIHSDVERAVRAARFLLGLNPRNAFPYVQLANIHADSGRLNDVMRLEKIMIDNGVKTVLSRSCIEVSSVVHEFDFRDTSHPQQEKIHAELQRLSRCIEEVGYVTDVSVLLCDVEVEEEGMLCYH